MSPALQTTLFALAAVAAGLVIGSVAGRVIRRLLGKETNRDALRAIAGPASSFAFWASTAAGVIFAVGSVSPESLRPLPGQLIAWLPNALVAGLLVLAGVAGGIAISGAVGRAVYKATGQKAPAVEKAIRAALTGGASILALGQMGVQTSIILVLVAGVIFSVALTFSLLAGLGGRQVAHHLAANRTLRAELVPGNRLITSQAAGTIVDVSATTVVIGTDDGRRLHIPCGMLLDGPFEIIEADTDA